VGLLSAGLPSQPTRADTPDNPIIETDVFFEDFSDNSARWVLGIEWQIGPATASSGQEYGNPDPDYDHTDTNDTVLRVLANRHLSAQLQPLISQPFNANAGADAESPLNSDFSPHAKQIQ
jgi:hypothetical protein